MSKYIKETFQEAADRMPELKQFYNSHVTDSIDSILNLADSIEGYSLFQYLFVPGMPPLFIHKKD